MTPRSAVAVHCHVRASSLVEPVDSTVERLRGFDRANVIDELRVDAWPDEVPLEGASGYADVLERVEAYRAWADRVGASIEPAFGTRERTTLVDDGTEAVLVLPVVCLSIHVRGVLTSVVPNVSGETTYTVDDALADLETFDYATSTAADRTADHPSASAADARSGERCPACGEGLESGQGLYACSSCSWVGIDPDGVGTPTRVVHASSEGDAGEPEPGEAEAREARSPDERPPRPPT